MVNVKNILCGYEWEIIRWIKENYKEIGYDKIIEENKRKVPDVILINHKTGQTIYHFQDDWLNITKEREDQIRKNLEDSLKSTKNSPWVLS